MEIIETILPIILIALAGYLAVYHNFLKQEECDALSKFVFTFVIPSLLFIGTAKAKLPDNMDWGFLLAFYGAVMLVYIISVTIGKFVFGYSDQEQSVFGMGAAYSNATIVGIPVCVYALGDGILLPLFILISIHNLALFTIGILVAERGSLSFSGLSNSLFDLFKQLITNPITGSLMAGGLVNLSGIILYKPLDDSITLLSDAAIPSALFVLGASLNKYRVRGHMAPALVMVILKIMVLPLTVWVFAFYVFILDPLWAATALLTSAMPVGISAYVFSQKYQVCEAPVATGIVTSTLGSILTLSVVLTYLQSFIL